MDDVEHLLVYKDALALCAGFTIGPINDVHSLLDELLKSLVQEESPVTKKLNIINFLELKSSVLFEEIGDIEIVLATLKNVFDISSSDQGMQGQCLISTTIILLEASEKFSGEEFDSLFTQHVNILLHIVNQNNCPENMYVRSIAADSLIEIELCYPLLLKPCLENVYAVTVREMSAAHQQYTALLSLMMKHCSVSSQLQSPLWNTYPQLVFKTKFLNENNSIVAASVQGNSQLISFLVDQLPYCNSEGVVWITSHIVEMLLHNTELRASCRVLKPLFFSCIYTFNCAIFHLLLYLEKVFGRELFEEEEHCLLLRQLLLNCGNPLLSSCTQLLYLDLLNDYLSRMCHQLKSIQDVSVLLPNYFDEPDLQLRKFHLLSNTLKHKRGSSKFMLQVANNMRKEAKSNKYFKYKSVLTKALFKFLSDYEDVPCEDITRLIVLVTIENVTITPYILHFIRQVQLSFPASSLPSSTLSSLVDVYTQCDDTVTVGTLTYIIDIFQEAILYKCSIECLKSVLSYIHKYILSDIVCKLLSWSLGHKILKFCYSAMKEYNTSNIFYELSNVLQEFVSKCENDDVQDRAQLYLGLLLSLSDKKLKGILQGPRQPLPRALTDDNTFHSKSCFQKLEKSVVSIQKMKYSLTSSNTMKFEMLDDKDIISSYKHFLTINSSCKKLVLRISLNISKNYVNLNCIEALVIFIDSSNNWGKIDPVMIGHVREDSSSPQESNSCVSSVTCYPHHPQPIQAAVRVEFSLENICHTCSLEPFVIEFSDYFYVLPVCDNITLELFFETLWNAFENEFQSVMILECSEEVARRTVEQKLNLFVVNEDSEVCYVGIYLPPGKHLLMKYQFQPKQTVVKFVTDYVYVLSLANIYLKEFI